MLEYKLVPNASGKYRGHRIKINSKGIRDSEHKYTKENNFFRAVVLGDSYTFGSGIKNLEDTYSNIIEDKLLSMGYPVEIINLGVSGYNTSQEIMFFKIEGIKYKPDLVILGFNLNDNHPSHKTTFNTQALKRYNLLWLKELVKNNIYSLTYIKKLIKEAISRIYSKKILINVDGLCYDGCIKQIIDFSQYLKSKDIELLVFILPHINDIQNYPYTQVHNYLKTNLLENKVACYDLYPYFKNLNAQDLCINRKDNHPSELGHSYIASFIVPELIPYIESKKKERPI